MFDEKEQIKFYDVCKKASKVLFRCEVTTQDGDVWCFHVPDIHSFCLKMYDYFLEKCDVFEIKVEREVQK